jgi:2,4-dienoyl-CoA reductase (NADPH2)
MLALAGFTDSLLERYLDWLIRQVDHAGVVIELRRRAMASDVTEVGADVVVVATGARWGRPQVAGADLSHVRTVPELQPWLKGDADDAVGAEVAVMGGGKAGLSLADLLVRRGRAVTVVEPTAVFGCELGLPGRWRLVSDLEAAGAVLKGSAIVEAILLGGVRVTVAGEPQDIKADTVVVASSAVPDETLAGELRASGVTVYPLGDCTQAGTLEGANLAAAELALAL